MDSFSAGNQGAFAELVGRHIDTVYSAARRQLRDPEVADDVTQAVFIILTQKAGKLDRRIPLGAWLLKTTHFACLDARKRQARRQKHERAAAEMAARREHVMTEVDSDSGRREEICQVLDAAMAGMSDRDRGAVTLRYLNGMSVNQTAEAMGITPAAAGKRITRALERLRNRLTRRGVIVPSAMLAVALGELPRFSASSALTQTVAAAVSLSGASSAGVVIAKGTLNIMNWIKLKIAAMVLLGTAAAAAAGSEAVVLLQDAPQPTAPAAAAVPVVVNDNNIPPAPAAFVGTLANGVSIEVIGVSENPSRGKPWWKADGSPLAVAPYRRMDGSVSRQAGQVTREFAVRVNDQPAGQAGKAAVSWFVVESRGSASGTVHAASGVNLELDAAAVTVDDDPNGVTIHADIAAGEWTTEFTTQNNPYGSSSESKPAGLLGFGEKSVLWGQPVRDGGKTRMMVACSGLATETDVRLVAIDRNGEEHPAASGGGVSNSAAMLRAFTSELPVNEIKTWELQTRPYDQWIEIRHIALHPGQNIGVQIATSDNP
jgi:RNA polymerase sigma factor (sigma-70 family)